MVLCLGRWIFEFMTDFNRAQGGLNGRLAGAAPKWSSHTMGIGMAICAVLSYFEWARACPPFHPDILAVSVVVGSLLLATVATALLARRRWTVDHMFDAGAILSLGQEHAVRAARRRAAPGPVALMAVAVALFALYAFIA